MRKEVWPNCLTMLISILSDSNLHGSVFSAILLLVGCPPHPASRLRAAVFFIGKRSVWRIPSFRNSDNLFLHDLSAHKIGKEQADFPTPFRVDAITNRLIKLDEKAKYCLNDISFGHTMLSFSRFLTDLIALILLLVHLFYAKSLQPDKHDYVTSL